jgi:hypothetical protein
MTDDEGDGNSSILRHYMEVSSQVHAAAGLLQGEVAPGMHCTGGCVVPQTLWSCCVREILLKPFGLHKRRGIS